MSYTDDNLLDIWQVVIGGRSSIDLTQLFIRNWDDASMFVRNYGFNPDLERDQMQIHSIFIESLFFIKHHLLSEAEWRAVYPPKEIFDLPDVRSLILWASAADEGLLRFWSCAILRLMHTIAHLDSLPRESLIPLFRRQLFTSFSKHLRRDESGSMNFEINNLSIPIEKIEWKSEKSRVSIIMKLLHKKANVAETIYDLIGIRLVTKNIYDILKVIQGLVESNIISFPNTLPARSRNFLINLKEIESIFKACDLKNELSREEMIDKINESCRQTLGTSEIIEYNQHSSEYYQSVQFTCRHIYQERFDRRRWVQELRHISELYKDRGNINFPKLFDHIIKIENPAEEKGIFHFIPFEVQLVDRLAYKNNNKGVASYKLYKESQKSAARKRVLGKLLDQLKDLNYGEAC